MSDKWEKTSDELTKRAEALKATEATNPNYEAEVKALKTEAAQLAIEMTNALIAALKSEADETQE